MSSGMLGPDSAQPGATAVAVRTVHVILPGDVDDPAAPSGGNTYDRRVCSLLPGTGWTAREIPVPGPWPYPDRAAVSRLDTELAAVADGGLVLIDGLVGCAAPDVVAAHAGRLRPVVLVHLPLADETGLPPAEAAELDAREGRALHAAAAIIATSAEARRRLITRHGLAPERIHAVPPGVDAAPLAPGTDGGSALACIAAVTPRKGQDVLVTALAALADLRWTCRCIGATDRDPGYLERLRASIRRHRLEHRVHLAGPRTGRDLAAGYAAADLVVLPSHAETYGMVVTEALARGVPVVATAVGGVPEALGRAPDGSLPGLLVPPGDPVALSAALRRWLTEPALRDALRSSARARRAGLTAWEVTARRLADVLDGVRRAGA